MFSPASRSKLKVTFSPYSRHYHLDGNSLKNNVSASGVRIYIPFKTIFVKSHKEQCSSGHLDLRISKRSSVSLMSGGNTGKILFNKPNRETTRSAKDNEFIRYCTYNVQNLMERNASACGLFYTFGTVRHTSKDSI